MLVEIEGRKSQPSIALSYVRSRRKGASVADFGQRRQRADGPHLIDRDAIPVLWRGERKGGSAN